MLTSIATQNVLCSCFAKTKATPTIFLNGLVEEVIKSEGKTRLIGKGLKIPTNPNNAKIRYLYKPKPMLSVHKKRPPSQRRGICFITGGEGGRARIDVSIYAFLMITNKKRGKKRAT